MKSPADDGIEGAEQDFKKAQFMGKLVEEFKDFVVDSMRDGLAVNLDDVTSEEDHLEFMRCALETFISLKQDENS